MFLSKFIGPYVKKYKGTGRLSADVLVLLLAWPNALLAQNLDLFEETESNNRPLREEGSRAIRRDSDGNIITGPEFILIGTTRVGGNFLVVVEDRIGEILSINVPDGAETSVPGYPGFQVVDVGPGNVMIRYPDSIPCEEFNNQGVSCGASNTARLDLTNAEPLMRTAVINGSNSDSLSQGEIDPENTPNPFEALLERASNPEVEADTSAFTPRRINPEDVPPGMRVVSTPFGDRLVEEE